MIPLAQFNMYLLDFVKDHFKVEFISHSWNMEFLSGQLISGSYPVNTKFIKKVPLTKTNS